MRRAVAIVCAKDEQDRIGVVLDTLVPVIPTLVVDDGSTDDTAKVAKRHGATVLRLPQNRGKGRAMQAGVHALGHHADVVLFVDADLLGLRPDHVRALVEPVLRGEYGMVVGMRDYGPLLNDVVRRLPLISGERAVRRDILDRMPDYAWQGYGVETWLNHVAAISGWPTATRLLDGLQIVTKWEKNPEKGFSQMVDMAAEVVKAHELAASHVPRTPATRFLTAGLPPARAPTPPSLTARGATTEDVMRELSRTLVEAGGPFVRDQMWTPEARAEVGAAVGQKLAAPLWMLCAVACAALFGPVAGAGVAVGGLALNSARP